MAAERFGVPGFAAACFGRWRSAPWRDAAGPETIRFFGYPEGLPAMPAPSPYAAAPLASPEPISIIARFPAPQARSQA